jgi:CheY-like chemotaxis protein
MKRKHCIVIVDDDADDREIIRDAFENSIQEQDYVFLENGDRLLEYLQQSENHKPSLIMLDLNMPGKDGRETLKEIKSNRQFHDVPTIIFTTSSSHRDRQNVYELGANCFVTKPDTFNKLVELTGCITRLWLQ